MKASRLLALAIEFWNRANRDRPFDLAAQLAFYFLLSLFPFLIFVVTLLGYANLDVDDILQWLQLFAPEDIMGPIESNLHEVFNQRKRGILSLSILGAIWAASAAMNAITRALNQAYEVEESRPFLKARAVAILLTILMAIGILVSLVLPVLGELILKLVSIFVDIPKTFQTIWFLARWIFSFFILVGAFVCIYYLAPNRRLQVRHVAIGAFFAATGWEIASVAFSYYLSNLANYSATYGSLGTIIALMIWFYLTALVIILGGELNAMMHARSRKSSSGKSATQPRPKARDAAKGTHNK